MIHSTFTCVCRANKEHRLVFDGGILGHYILEVCASCYAAQNKKFLVKEEIINEKSN